MFRFIMRFITACLLSFALCVFIGKVHAEDYEDDQDDDDQTCSMTESIIGGTVKYSNNGLVKSEVTYFCKDGFKPYPIPKKICKPTGKWEPDISRVVCEEEIDYDYIEEPQKNCSVAEIIKGGEVSYSNEGLEGSVLTYHCNIGYYAYPVSTRVCNPRGDWSVMILPNGKTVSTATCKDILCPAQLQLDNGQFWPKKQWFKIGEVQEFSCREGLTLSGSAKRNCTEWGHWTGNLPVCIDQTDGCTDPGIPPGAIRSGERFEIGDQVKYRCQSGMDLLGPEVRVCLDSKEWSGPEPRCQAPYVFDLPASVAQAMDGSLSAVMDVSFPELEKKRPNFGRSLNIANGRLNIFILIDTSGSINNDQFQKAKEATASLIRKLSSYDVEMKFDIISYASEPKDIITVMDYFSDNTDAVLTKLKLFTQTKHGEKTGTNLFKALKSVHDRLSFLKANNKTRFSETQNVILIETDGYSNMGGDPQYILGLIRLLMGYKSSSFLDNSHEDLLDVYVFGIGENVKKAELKRLASSKIRERHFFVLKNYEHLGEVFNRMINDTTVTKCGVAQELVSLRINDDADYDNNPSQPAYTRPWHVSIGWLGKPCQGSILTKDWVITSAHCLMRLNDGVTEWANAMDVKITHGDGIVNALLLIPHPDFNVTKLKDKNVNEFYDYDVALIKVLKSIKLSSKARPVCLPCTKASNRALKMSSDSTCKKHESALLDLQQTQAYFISQAKTRKPTHIQTGEKRDDCLKQYRPEPASNNQVSLTDVITDRFLCTGGSEKYRDYITCKGDSGGSLFLRKGMRYFQVGVVSWGTKNVCDLSTSTVPDPPVDARDFHISVFSIMPWLKEQLGRDLEFIPN
ncbi:complement factor B isoform X1 [Tachysurus fulvidraco]|uniref:complement factor B isoform X1 n=1 Tax=Tachysurus fulvidraco TaxID=1234273 RepID=UPI001FEE94DC|nr:complement factor B isoform X1 [Tachysurus fulvidraco]